MDDKTKAKVRIHEIRKIIVEEKFLESDFQYEYTVELLNDLREDIKKAYNNKENV